MYYNEKLNNNRTKKYCQVPILTESQFASLGVDDKNVIEYWENVYGIPPCYKHDDCIDIGDVITTPSQVNQKQLSMEKVLFKLAVQDDSIISDSRMLNLVKLRLSDVEIDIEDTDESTNSTVDSKSPSIFSTTNVNDDIKCYNTVCGMLLVMNRKTMSTIGDCIHSLVSVTNELFRDRDIVTDTVITLSDVDVNNIRKLIDILNRYLTVIELENNVSDREYHICDILIKLTLLNDFINHLS